jgi:Domain of unknown function (DUF397)
MSETERHDSILVWRKSSYSLANGACVEAAAAPGAVVVRDTVSPARGQLHFPARTWREFVARVKGA